MLCVKCQRDFPEKDFYGSPICYKCVYSEKTTGARKKVVQVGRKKPLNECKICGNLTAYPKFCCWACRRKSFKGQKKYFTGGIGSLCLGWSGRYAPRGNSEFSDN